MIKIGFVEKVESKRIQILLDELNTQDVIFHDGVRYEMPKIGQYLAVQYLDIKIVVRVESEEVGELFDRNDIIKRITEDSSFQRKLYCSIIGYFDNDKFSHGIKYSPIVMNKVTLLSDVEISEILGIGKEKQKGIKIGKSLVNDLDYYIDVMNFFNTHIAIFGNTGSGKSNTLTKIYKEVFKNFNTTEQSTFTWIDFNGEYIGDDVLTKNKNVVKLNTIKTCDKLKMSKDLFFNADILGMLFSATEKTQKPFLKKTLEKWQNAHAADDLYSYMCNVLRNLFTKEEEIDENTRAVLMRFFDKINNSCNKYVTISDNLNFHSKNRYFYVGDGSDYHQRKVSADEQSDYFYKKVLLNDVNSEEVFDNIFKCINEADYFDELLIRAELSLISSLTYNNDRYEFVNPLINKIEESITSLKKVIEVIDNREETDNNVTIISLKECNQETKKILPLLIGYSLYNECKQNNDKTTYLIIDEAHNILSKQSNREGESWKDYRLETFEEIIKEGRKFGFFLTIASQRPSDISDTIVSQVHNFFIHKLVNENDIQKIRNCVSTLSSKEFDYIPSLPKGACIISGTAMDLSQTVQIDAIIGKEHRPNSDDYTISWLPKEDE